MISSVVIKCCFILFSVRRIIFICELSALVSIIHDIVMRVSKYCNKITRGFLSVCCLLYTMKINCTSGKLFSSAILHKKFYLNIVTVRNFCHVILTRDPSCTVND